MMRRVCCAVLLLFLRAAGQAAAQNRTPADGPPADASIPSSDPGAVPVLRTTTRNVILDIVVTDRSGRPVRDLRADDFVVREDKKAQSIHLIATPSTEASDAAQRGVSGETPDRRSLAAAEPPIRNMVLLDETNVRFFDLARARQRLAVFFRSPAARGQTFALLTLQPNRFVLEKDFSNDGEALARAVERMPAVLPGTADDSQFADSTHALENLRRSMGVIETLAHSLQGSAGHVNLFWITSGFPTLSGIDMSQNVQFMYDQLMRRASNLYLNARMTIYTIDPFGVQWIDSLPNYHSPDATRNQPSSNLLLRGGGEGGNMGDRFAAQQNNMSSNEAIANDLLGNFDARTGGRAFENNNLVDDMMREALADGSSVYTVAYVPADRRFDGKFRAISVEVKRPGLTARTREGYYAVDRNKAESTEVSRAQIESALDSPMPYRALAVRGEVHGTAPRTVLQVDVGPGSVEWTFSGTRAHVAQTVAVAVYSRGNKPIFSREWHVATDRSDGAGETDIEYALPFALPPGAARMRVAVADREGIRMGTGDVPIGEAAGAVAAAGAGQALRTRPQ